MTMKMRPWADFLSYTRPHVPDMPVELNIHCLRLAAIEFARETRVLKQENPLVFQQGLLEYPLPVDGCFNFVALEAICAPCGVFRVRAGDDCNTYCCERRVVQIIDRCNLRLLSGSEHENEVWKVTVSVAPTEDACDVPAYLYEHHAQAVANGALSELFMYKESKYFSPELAGYRRKMFVASIANERNVMSKGYSTGTTMLRSPRFV